MSQRSEGVSSASVLLLVYQHKRVESCLSIVEDIQTQTTGVEHDVEVVVIADDAHSSDDEESVYDVLSARLDGQDDTVVVPDREERRLAEARNYAAVMASGEAYLFVDDDVTLSDEWLSSMLDAYDDGEIAVGGPAYPDWETHQPSYLPDEMLWLVGATHNGFTAENGYVRNVFGCNFSVRADVFDSLGGFPEHLGKNRGKALQGEETALSVKIRNQYDTQMRYVEDAAVYHMVDAGQTTPSYLLDRAYWQGYSKAQFDPTALDDETRFLTFALRQSVLHLFKGSAIASIALLVLVGAVGLGFVMGSLSSTFD